MVDGCVAVNVRRCGDDAGGFLRNITSAPPYAAANPPGGNLLSNGTTAITCKQGGGVGSEGYIK